MGANDIDLAFFLGISNQAHKFIAKEVILSGEDRKIFRGSNNT